MKCYITYARIKQFCCEIFLKKKYLQLHWLYWVRCCGKKQSKLLLRFFKFLINYKNFILFLRSSLVMSLKSILLMISLRMYLISGRLYFPFRPFINNAAIIQSNRSVLLDKGDVVMKFFTNDQEINCSLTEVINICFFLFYCYLNFIYPRI